MAHSAVADVPAQPMEPLNMTYFLLRLEENRRQTILLENELRLMKEGQPIFAQPPPAKQVTPDPGFIGMLQHMVREHYLATTCHRLDIELEILQHRMQLIFAVNNDTQKLIKIKCLPNHGYGTVQVTRSYKDVLNIITPADRNASLTAHKTAGGAKDLPGNCAFLMFYGRSCPFSAEADRYFSAMAQLFPDIRFGAIDAYKLHKLNAELGVVSVPTFILFHEGHAISRYLKDGTTFSTTHKNVVGMAHFINTITGLPTTKFTEINFDADKYRFISGSGGVGEIDADEPDLCLWLAWTFILVCAAYYFTKSNVFNGIVEALKRNWRESEEAQHLTQ